MSIISTWDDVTSTVIGQSADVNDFIGTRDDSVQLGKLELLNVGYLAMTCCRMNRI